MAGHSKWANIQHRKGKQDKLRSKMFSKLAKEITVAAKMGDPDPDKNPRLRLAVKAAKAVSMPKDVIDRAIKKSQMGDGADYTEIRYEGYGMAYAEALAQGLPVIGTTAGAIPDTVPAIAGLLAEPGDVDSLRQALRQIIQDQGLRQRLAQGALLAAAQQPSWADSAALFEKTIECACSVYTSATR